MISAVNLYKILLLACSLLLAGCLRNEAPVEIKEIKGDVFGSYYIIKFRGDLDTNKFNQDLNAFFAEFNNQYSTYQPNSVISQFNQSAKNSPKKVSAQFISMLKMAEKFHTDTQGAFDPTLGPVIKLWGFGGGKTRKVPTDKELAEAQKKVGFKFIKWNEAEQTVWKTVDGLHLDVNAFAPGWACDLIGKMLEKNGIKNYMVDISGEILFRGKKTEKDNWIAGIEKPSKEYAQGVQLALKLEDLSISTSGNYRQFYDEKGQRFSHIIDPRTGRPVAHQIASSSVITASAAEADAWSTAMMVLGPEGLAIAEKHGIKVFLLDVKSAGSFEEVISPSMKLFIEDHRL